MRRASQMSEIIRMLDKIDKLDERLDNIDKTLVRQEGHLKEHIRRTEQNEIMIQEIIEQIKPIETHVAMVNGVLKFIGFISLLLGVAVAVKDLLA